MDALDTLFDSYADASLFKNKMVLQSNYSPEMIPHREEQINMVASILAPVLRGERVSNLFVYGKTGSGKTLSVHHVGNKIVQKAKERGNESLQYIYLNCKLKKV